MPAPKPSIEPASFDALVKRTGLTLTEAQKDEHFAAHGYVEAIAERVRAGGKRSREAEPAPAFKPKAQ
jgi:hypothetical protein